ncbi:IS21-like element ISSme2 family helper ATPase IstB [Actinocorallia aurea]
MTTKTDRPGQHNTPRAATAADLLTPRPRSDDHDRPGGRSRSAQPLPDYLDEPLLKLKLHHGRAAAPDLLASAKADKWSYEEFLRQFLAAQMMGVDEARRLARVRAARFAANAKSFASWKPELPSIGVEVQQALIALDWARRKETVVFAGPSGTGKSHLAGALSRHAIEHDMRVVWQTLETLGNQLNQAKVDGTVTRTIAKICTNDIIVIDDIGVLPVEPIQAEAFYRIIDTAYERRSIILTSNTHPKGFDSIMPKTLASAGVDRLLHHAHLILTSGESFRLIDAKNGGGVIPLVRNPAE